MEEIGLYFQLILYTALLSAFSTALLVAFGFWLGNRNIETFLKPEPKPFDPGAPDPDEVTNKDIEKAFYPDQGDDDERIKTT